MADHTFYSTENHHNERQIRIMSVGSLVSKPPAKEKRISIKARMLLSGTVNMGAPEFIDNGYMFVAKNHGQTVTPSEEFKGYSIDFSVENLFGVNVSNKNCTMRSFEITEIGEEEAPDVVLNFTLRMQFSTALWNWCGQYVGDEIWARFTPPEALGASEDEEDGTTLDDGENDEDSSVPDGEEFDPALDTPVTLEYEDGPKLVTKSGPAELAAFHADLQKDVQEVVRKRGRPRKNPVDPITVESPAMAF